MYFEQILEAAPHKTTPVQPLTSHLKNHPSKMNKICGTLLEKQRQTHVTFFYGPLHMDMPVLTDQQKLAQDVV